ncbi:hypothetical protein AB840_15055 [Megasphaera cerevisiae DSM 20462]|jgi:hypothetical protein|uniref:Helix-turn-helix domain-containing protein n=1 Tax=Megasphaera cerevisiae DSM 20462 TaxID=1122219 RepID=A0A0J6ZJX1_9FIRM|nr:helix-turn-helix domain-containing protein [Megasphaera cerevisiae]KMO85181.1 hypothetical protein AB840_15055 [Megasphaera cerevisiae DSM 20462]SKA27941.1 Helix-turn-helix domain-containing protein [Megasphaera cerevisiae DSM 20462]
MESTLTVEAAAKILHVSPQFIRCGLKAGKLPFGTALDMNGRGKRYRYIIYPKRLQAFMDGNL